MAVQFKSPTDIATEYLTHLSGLRPDINTANEDSDWWIRSRVVGGVLSGLVADQLAISNDAFPQNARLDAIANHLQTYFDGGFNPATASSGVVAVTGTIGTDVPVGTLFSYIPNGNSYISTSDVVLAATAALIPVVSSDIGQGQNIFSDSPLTISNAPAGLNSTAAASGDITGASNPETTQAAAQRILTFIRKPISGGTENDYKQYASQADSSVITANVIRYAFGLGTIAIVITAGTNDIDSAIDNDQPISVIPSEALVEKVQTYINTVNPETDNATVLAATGLDVAVTVSARFSTGDVNTIVPGTVFTQGELVAREVRRAIYKTPPGGRQFGASGFLVKSEIEDSIDTGLGNTTFVTGQYYQIIIDRKVNDLSVSGPNLSLLGVDVAIPGVINVVDM